MKYIVGLIVTIVLLSSSVNVSAEGHGRAAAAVPTLINTVRDEGMMIYGAFGNPAGCEQGNQIWVERSHPEYDKLYSTALAAFMGEKKLDMYIHACVAVPWLAGDDVTFNRLMSAGDFRISN